MAPTRRRSAPASAHPTPSGTAAGTAAPLVPPRPTLASLRAAAAGCRACPLWERATQTVFGQGAARAELVLVGEQPGDQEDRQGQPFIGPAGGLLDRSLEAAGIDRARTYVTNVVKHFKWEARGKKRIHQKPSAGEIEACRPWLEAELTVLRPTALLLLGATAAQAILGRRFKVTEHRGEILAHPFAPFVMATVHPSSILRAPDDAARRLGIERFVEDLRRLRAAVEHHRTADQLAGSPS